jgi:acyl-CoA reductase-like NAD-dependent aldehyde dehydrogenase
MQFGMKNVGNCIVHLAGVNKPNAVPQSNNTRKNTPPTKTGKRTADASASSAVDITDQGASIQTNQAKRQKKGNASTSSSSAAAAGSSSSARSARRPAEKRSKRLRTLTQKLRERQHRALAQRMFLVSRKAVSDDSEVSFFTHEQPFHYGLTTYLLA